MAKLIDAGTVITYLLWDDEHDCANEETTTIEDWLEHHTNEGCPIEAVVRCKECIHCFYGGSKTGKRFCVRKTPFEVEIDGFCKWGQSEE